MLLVSRVRPVVVDRNNAKNGATGCARAGDRKKLHTNAATSTRGETHVHAAISPAVGNPAGAVLSMCRSVSDMSLET